MEHGPLISVVIPAYNCEKFLSQTLDSVLNQTYENLEVIAVDDFSSDSTWSILKQYEEIDNRVFALKNDKNRGVSETRNRGVACAKGEWIAFLDGDDLWDRKKLELQMRLIQATGCYMCSTARSLLDENSENMGRMIAVPEQITYNMLLKTNYIVCSSVLAKKSILLEFPMSHDELHEDYICWLQISRKYGAIYGLNVPVVSYRISKKSSSANKWKCFLQQKRSYQYLGIGFWKRWSYLLAYSFNGIRKYSGI